MKYVPILVLLPAMVHGQECIDPDGDGWGWNGQQSCLIEDTSTQPPTTSTTTPSCLFPTISDPDGDGFGWENNASCSASDDTMPPNTNDSIWFQSLAGKWYCQDRFPQLSTIEDDPHGWPGYSYTQIDSWDTTPQSCSRGCGIYGSYHTMTFIKTHVAIERFQSHQPHQNIWLGTDIVPWSIENHIFKLNDKATQKYGFENFEGSNNFHYYLTNSDRVTCKKL